MSEEITPITQALVAAEVVPAVGVVPVEAAPVVPETKSPEEAIKDLTPAERRKVLFEPEALIETDPAVVVEPPKVEPVVAVVPPVEPVKVDDDKSDELTKNFRLHTEDPKQSAFLKAHKAALSVNPNANPIDSARLVGYDIPGAPTPTVVPEIPTPVGPSPLEAQVTAQEEVVDAIMLERKEYEHEPDAYKGELEVIDGRIREARTALKTAERALLTEQLRTELRSELAADKSQAQRRTAREQSKADVLIEYPTANSETSMLGKEITLLYNAIMADPNHPDRAKLAADDGPAWITREGVKSKVSELVTNLGLTEAQAMKAVKGKPIAEAKGPAVVTPPPNPQAAPVPRNILVTAPGGNPAPEALAPSEAQIMEAARNDPKLRRAALGFASNMVIS